MTISIEKIHKIAAGLAEFRGDGYGAVLFDSRDAGNYSEYNWDSQAKMVERADPTGLALGMLVLEMIAATVRGSRVMLERVLREAGFVDYLKTILALETDLLLDVQEPRARLMTRLTDSLNRISGVFGTPSTREVTICLRDAIYSMERGLTLRWLQCDDVSMLPHSVLCPVIHHFKSLPEFMDALRTTLPIGAHLAQIGAGKTAIGIKQPGRIAFLSSLCLVRGSMKEERAHNYLHAENLDLSTPVERYPEWTGSRKSSTGRETVDPSKPDLNHISSLPRDRLLWLAMVVEMATQRMAVAESGKVDLAEVMVRALPPPPGDGNLPAVIEANWRIAELSIEETFDSLGLADWESEFLRPALQGMSVDAFFRISKAGGYGIELSNKQVVSWPDDRSFEVDQIRVKHVEMTAANDDLAGTRREVESDRQRVFGSNLVKWLLAWGNHQFQQSWIEHTDWFRQALADNLPLALKSSCVTWRSADYRLYDGVQLYTQHPKRKMNHPMCFFNAKLPVTKVAHIVPANSLDFVELLGLKSEAELPKFLQGWSRAQSWTTGDCNPHDNPAPFGSYHRWGFCAAGRRKQVHSKLLEVTVLVNDASLPID